MNKIFYLLDDLGRVIYKNDPLLSCLSEQKNIVKWAIDIVFHKGDISLFFTLTCAHSLGWTFPFHLCSVTKQATFCLVYLSFSTGYILHYSELLIFIINRRPYQLQHFVYEHWYNYTFYLLRIEE